MATEADLIARIVDDPDDRDAFVVYGDYLIERGDPRGELIALHAQGHDADAERLLDARRSELVGEVPPEVTLRWHLGFVREVAIEGGSADEIIPRIAAVLALPACRFLRRLAIDRDAYIDHPLECGRIDRWLATHGGPSTIDRISIESLGEQDLSEALLEAFPRIARPVTPWPAIASAIAGLDATELAVDPTTLPALTLASGEPLPLTPIALLHGLVFEAGGRGDLRLLACLRARCDATSLDRYAAGLAERALAPGAQLPWAFPVIERLGGPHTAYTLGRIRLAANDSFAWQRCLVSLRTPLARLELFAANGESGTLAYDSVAPSRDALARAGADPVDTLEPELAARFAELDLRALEELLVTGWTTPLRTAIELFVHAPRAPRAAGLVWGRRRAGRSRSIVRRIFAVPADDETEPFFITAAGAVDATGRALGVDLDEPVWLAHPAELTDEELATWRTLQRARSPQLVQLDRWLPMPRTRFPNRIAAVRALLDPFPTQAALYARGYTDAATPTYGTGPAVAKRYRYRDKSHLITVDFGTRYLHRGNDLTMVVLHEVARDLVDAARAGRPGPRVENE